jgi:hypothetical protein
MPKAAKKSKALLKFKRTVEVEVRLPEFEPLASLKSLDYRRLEKGNHTVEVGFLSGGCCRKLVRAVVKNGMVTGFEVEPCKETRPASPELKATLKEAHRRLAKQIGKWQPFPISEINKVAPLRISWGGGCIQICEFGYCLTCCFWRWGLGCFTDPIYIGPLS